MDTTMRSTMSNFITSRLLLLLLVVVASAAVTSGAAQLLGGAPICETLVPYSYDSGLITTNNSNNATSSSSAALLSSRTKKVVISYPNATYIQLDLSATHLANDDKLVLRSVNGHGDGPVTTQIVTRDALTNASNGYSAIFMGSSVSIKLVVQRHSRLQSNEGATSASSSSRVIISHILVGGLCGSKEDNSNNININKISGDGGSDNNDVITPFSICGTSDGRLPSSDIRQGRISLGGSCTAFMISKSIFVTAGHCGNATSNSRLKFTFNGTDTPVVPENQYAIELSTYKKVYEYGVDWAAGRILPNAVTGNYPTSWYSIDTSLPAVGKTVRVTGYGTDNYDNTDTNGGGLNITCRLCQQTHLGKITDTVSGAIRHNVDTMAGDSGAPLILESSGKVVAIHTNGGCSAGSSTTFNVAKRFTQEFLNHINDLQGRPAATLVPTSRPTTNKPTNRPTSRPTTKLPTLRPTTTVPTTLQPTDIPTHSPTTASPISSSSPTTSTPTTSTPSSKPSLSPTTSTPTTSSPLSNKPSLTPTMVIPTSLPTTWVPTFKPAKPVKTSLPTSLNPTSTNPTTRTPSSSKPTSWKPTTSSPTFVSVKLTTPLCTTAGNVTTRKCFRQNGNMFSLDAKVNVTILSISVYSLSTATGIAAEVWTRSGNYTGYELNSTAWTKVGVSSINNNVGDMKSIPLSQVVNVNRGSRQSFYVTMSTNTSYVLYGGNYTGTVPTSSPIQQQSEFVQNNDISIHTMGTANEYPFVRVIAPRYFNGEVVYRKR